MDRDETGKARPQPQISRKRMNPFERTLAILVQSMRGEKVVVELKNDTEISGVLEETDRNMNLSMVDVRQTNPNGTVRKMDMVMVQGTMIRYVHIPDEVDAISNLKKHMRAMEEQKFRRQMLRPKRGSTDP